MWLSALPGTGKTRVLLDLAGHLQSTVGGWTLLDDPSEQDLQAAVIQCGSTAAVGRLLVASRASAAASRVLLTPRLYGRVEVIDEHDLFMRPSDCRSAKDAEAFAATGGWPMLIDGFRSGRSREMALMLPAFLEREVLPELPPALITAMFGSLLHPLGSAAVEDLFGEERLSPLLRRTTDGVAVAGEWLRDALVILRTRPRFLGRALRDDLIRLHTRFDGAGKAIIALIEWGLHAQAVELYEAAGGIFFGYRHGYKALESVLQKFGPEWERRTESLFLARMYLMIKQGQSREALMRLESVHPGLPVDLRRMRLSHRPYAVLIRLDLSLDIDDTPPLDVISSWERLGALFEPDDDMARGILCNTLAIGFLQSDALVQAQQFAREALGLYERAASPYLVHYMLLHLCDISLRQGRLRDAAEEVRRAQRALRASGMAFNSEAAVFECFEARIAYEEGRFADCPQDIEPILQTLLRGDSWASLISAMASHFVFAAFWQQGLRIALERLDHCALTLSRRHGAAQNRYIELIRIRLYQIARRHEEAAVRLEEYDLDASPQRAPHLEIEAKLIRLRQQIVQHDLPDAALKFAATLANLPSLEPRHRITLGILQAYLRHRRVEHGIVRRHLSVALRQAQAHGYLGVLVEDGEFLERMLPLYVAKPTPGSAPLTLFAERVARLLRHQSSTPAFSKMRAGVTRQEHRVLSYVADGYTNKQIARAFDCSESVVKFHLRNLFAKFKVSSRSALSDAVSRRGIKT